MNRNVLIITTLEAAAPCARTLAEHIGARVEIAPGRKAALLAIKREEFGLVVIEESLAEADLAWAEHIWQLSGSALPLELNLATSGTARLTREVKAALARRDREQALARKAIAREMEDELKSAVTGIMLESELALREPALPPPLQPKLRRLVELAGTLRERLRRAGDEPAARPTPHHASETATMIA